MQFHCIDAVQFNSRIENVSNCFKLNLIYYEKKGEENQEGMFYNPHKVSYNPIYLTFN